MAATEKKKDLGLFCKIISASATNDDGNLPTGAIDNDYATRWSSDVSGAELTLELAEVCPVAYVGVSCFKGDERCTILGISVSEDGASYTRAVDKFTTAQTTAMVPIPLGKTYNAKFVKIHGYGNTSNAWTSICEVRVYSPSADGSMPTDPNAPRQITLADLPENVQKALLNVEKYYEGVIPWLANMYDPETHGFYMSMSGRLDPDMQPAVEMTCWGLSFLNGYTCALKTMPEDFRQNLIKFFHDRQDPETGFFIDKQGPVNAREQARNQDSSLGALNILKAQPKYPHPRQSADAKKSADSVMMPDYMKSPEDYIAWVSSLNWETGSWTAGDQTQSSQQYIKMLPESEQEKYKKVLFDWLEACQFEHGLWAPSIDFNSASGAFKVGLIYQFWGKKLPNHHKIIDSIFVAYNTTKTSNPFYVRNPLSVLKQMSAYDEETKEKIQRLTVENIDAVVASFGEFLCPDGAFSSGKWHVTAKYFGGVQGSHGLYEGDIDATLMMLIARKMVYAIFDIKAPDLNTDNFWAWIDGSLPLPDAYAAVADIVEPLPEDMQQYAPVKP